MDAPAVPTWPERPERDRAVGLVLSGGGVRGAYAAGALSALIECVGERSSSPPPFQVLAGTSAGALTAGYLASHADKPDLGVEGLIARWRSLSIDAHLRLDPRAFLPAIARRRPRALLDVAPIEQVILGGGDWEALHDHIREGRIDALLVPALEVSTGVTHVFAETRPGLSLRPSRDQRRRVREGPIGPEHLLASSALPLIFPPRQIGEDLFVDGGLRFNTPIAPALRAGAEALVVISLMGSRMQLRRRFLPGEEPDLVLLVGKLLNALLLDPVEYDIETLKRTNQMLALLERRLSPMGRREVEELWTDQRGAPYRNVPLLALSPSGDLGEMAADAVREMERDRSLSRSARAILSLLDRPGRWELDLASFLIFDGRVAGRFIDAGYEDTRRRRDEICRFYDTVRAPR